MERSALLLILCAWIAPLVPGVMLQVQAQPGFISIDCGVSNAYKNTRLNNMSFDWDNGYIDSGENKQISTEYIYAQYGPMYKNLRSFPNGTRNCYTIRPDKGKNNTYLIRTSFLYGNYDEKNLHPIFDLYIDVNYWATVDASEYVEEEILYVPQRDEIQVCLINIGKGVPFISALLLRTLNNSIYQIQSGFLRLNVRYDIGRLSSTIRYPYDVYDRIWKNWTLPDLDTFEPGTSTSDKSNNSDAYKVPWEVLRTAQMASDIDPSFVFNCTPYNSTSKCIGYFHFAETQSLPSGQRREFTVSTSDGQFMKMVGLEYLRPVTVVSTPVSGSQIFFFNATMSRTRRPLPPIINALETFSIQELPNLPTAQDDAKVLKDTKEKYDIKKDSWQGDPCVPSKFAWYGVTCSKGDHPRVISLNLSSSNLRGDIHSSLSHLSELKAL